MFSEDERLKMIEMAVNEVGLKNVTATSFGGLTIHLAKAHRAITIIRGLRLVTDYEAELDISFNNRQLAQSLGIKVYTIFLPPNQEHIHIRSSTVRELLSFKQTALENYLPPTVLQFINNDREI
jgi:pantetheine-phosphate adenylyltransferase